MEENDQVSFTDSAERARLDSDPMYALEKGKKDKNVLEDRKPALSKLQIENFKRHGDNFELNRALRAGLRYAKKMDGAPTEEEKQIAKGLRTKNFINRSFVYIQKSCLSKKLSTNYNCNLRP